MKKIRLFSLFLVLVLLVSLLAACNKRGGVVEAFTEAGYDCTAIASLTEEDDRALLLKMFGEEVLDALPECEILVFSKYLIPGAAVFCFESSSALREYLNEMGEDAYEAAREEGRVLGNCYLAYAGYGTLEIFSGK